MPHLHSPKCNLLSPPCLSYPFVGTSVEALYRSGPGVDSATSRNEYWNLPGGRERPAGRRVRLTSPPSVSHLFRTCENLDVSHSYDCPRSVTAISLTLYIDFPPSSEVETFPSANPPQTPSVCIGSEVLTAMTGALCSGMKFLIFWYKPNSVPYPLQGTR
jgi:hypothetical protein